ncbi:trafficking protein particle complex subunit 9-like [Platysternon megacephalum]|uniref:Trafficking protein particle complex subunit 9-like n=1 Tax=Platysternon megacephalum TaxID=55544 RepID=A0A4D9E3B6_9SAUR|nr:trafficking protein particle complex subunit 9-like [Platysternon megacephalum]
MGQVDRDNCQPRHASNGGRVVGRGQGRASAGLQIVDSCLIVLKRDFWVGTWEVETAATDGNHQARRCTPLVIGRECGHNGPVLLKDVKQASRKMRKENRKKQHGHGEIAEVVDTSHKLQKQVRIIRIAPRIGTYSYGNCTGTRVKCDGSSVSIFHASYGAHACAGFVFLQADADIDSQRMGNLAVLTQSVAVALPGGRVRRTHLVWFTRWWRAQSSTLKFGTCPYFSSYGLFTARAVECDNGVCVQSIKRHYHTK